MLPNGNGMHRSMEEGQLKLTCGVFSIKLEVCVSREVMERALSWSWTEVEVTRELVWLTWLLVEVVKLLVLILAPLLLR